MQYKRVLKYIFLSIPLLFIGIQLHAQNIKFEHYTDNDGLSHNAVRHIIQDENGFLWLGTFSGLNRFDGFEFKSYTTSSETSNAIQNDDITALELDTETNTLWIGTRNGLTRFDMTTNTFKTFLPNQANPNSIQDHEIRSVHVDRFKRVWVGTKNKGVFVYYPKLNTFEKIDLPEFYYIKDIFEDSKGQIWIGSYKDNGIAKITLDEQGNIISKVEFNLTIPNSSELNPYVNFIYENNSADIFIGTREGLYKLNTASNKFENLFIEDVSMRDKIGPHITSIAQASDGKYWLGTLGGILVTESLENIAKQEFTLHYSELSDDNSLVDDLVSSLYFDASGVLWIGTEDGLDKYDPFENQFKTNKEISKYIQNQIPRIRGFAKTYDDKIIVATRHNGLFIYQNGHYAPLYNKQKDIASIYSFDGQTFYCGLWNGEVLVYDYAKNTSKKHNVGFQKSPVLAIAKIGENKLLIGSHGEGVLAVHMNSFENFEFAGTTIVDNEINKIIVDGIDKIWFATQAGVYLYDPFSEQTKTYETNPDKNIGLSHSNVSDLTIDPEGNIWAATRNGLNYFDRQNDNFTATEVPLELQNKWITDLFADTKGDLWLNVNNNQVARYNTASKTVKTYHTNSGNRLDVFSLSGFYYSDDNNVFLGGKNGIISFSPQALLDNNYAPPPIITNIRIQNKEIEIGSRLNGQQILQEDINKSRLLELNNENKNFAFTFSSPSYINERFNKYSYILEGFDETWNTVDVKQRTVQYTNLFFGDYIFKVKAMNSNGVWSETASYDIKISPPFWLTYKAFALLLLLLAVIFYLVRRQIKIRIRLKEQLLMEKVKRERDEKLSNEKIRFFTNISHELRTPLTLILGPVKQLIEEGRETNNTFQNSKFELINRNANRLLNLVNQVLDFRKSQADELNLKVSKTDILARTKVTYDSFQELAENKKIQFNFISENKKLEGYLDCDKYDKILYNLLSNAFKFTHKYGNVDVFLSMNTFENQTFLELEVSDNGIGIPLASQEKIFNRFYQAKNSKENNTGSGIGLSLVNALVELHKGSITVQSTTDQGSVFIVKIPIDRNNYQDNEVFEYEKNQEFEESPQLITAKKIIQSTEIKERILIIEDNTELRNYLVDFLSDYYKVFEAENGQKALQICSQIKPIVCVADIMMPVMNGLEFCNKLKNDASISHIPVILLTALAESDDKIKGYNSGADAYLVKPFDPSLLKTRIDNIIKSRTALKRKFSADIESNVKVLTHSPIDEEFMLNINRLIEENIGNLELNSGFLCAELGMSSSKLYRKIKELTDLAPNEFIRTIRLKKSAQLLKTKKYNVSEVTDYIGFNDPLYFSRCFKKQFGYPPSHLIK
ncbi:response regulator [Aurantibacter crassamenti]|uniref:hybrid sensor histidine kinase/response regulator transcription factor n=1 Tax=Aurantibacter crassamenti TaxID=1837375 RepID=UPI00193A86FB|nr:hybrid sensor histidine kinase/response regulator transcription factor [Aurantibacter crassamenti]MBM1105619.1 response regulator [Aurantibacter crassamenti]